MTKTMVFNGVDMSRFIKIKDIIRPIGNERSVTFDNAPSLGVNIQQVKRGKKEHTIKFDMIERDGEALERLKHELAGVLNVLEPVKVVYSDEPDKHYMGLPVDEITPENLTRWFQRSEFKLVIPDGVAHSSAYKRFDSELNAKKEGNRLVFDIVNNGTEAAYPIITIKHNSENGYVGIVNANSAFEIGDRKEADTETVKRSEVLLDFRGDEIADGFSRAVKNVSETNSPENLNGTSELVTVAGKKRVKLREQFSGTYNVSYSTGLSWEIPADSTGEKGSLNDYIFCKLVYQLESINVVLSK